MTTPLPWGEDGDGSPGIHLRKICDPVAPIQIYRVFTPELQASQLVDK